MLILSALLTRLLVLDAYRRSFFSVLTLNDEAMKQIGFNTRDITKMSRTMSFGG